jgi:tRNA G10  N-methylase Trm11
MNERFIRLNFISGLSEIVTKELEQFPTLSIQSVTPEALYLASYADLHAILHLRSITHAFLVKRGENLHPAFLANHKSVLMELVEEVLAFNNHTMRTFSLSCAGNDSDEVKSIIRHLENQYKLFHEPDHADLKIYIGKNNAVWEIGVELTPRPISERAYKVAHIKGGMHPTIAYAMNSLCDLPHRTSYLNPCSGSATLLIEAAQLNATMQLVGFDNNKEHLSLSIQNLKQAKLLTLVQVKYLNLLDRPNLGRFDVIASDLPFGMHIGKHEDLDALYQACMDLCEASLAPGGILALYTTETKLLERLLENSPFEIVQKLNLKVVTNVDSYIYPTIFICARPTL